MPLGQPNNDKLPLQAVEVVCIIMSIWTFSSQFFAQMSYIIGGQVFSLNDIESGVLRSNRKPVVAFRRPFSNQDPR